MIKCEKRVITKLTFIASGATLTGIFQAAKGIKHTHTNDHVFISTHDCLTTHFPCVKRPNSYRWHNAARRTHEILDQLRVGHEGLRVCVYGVSAVLNLPQGFKVAQQHITEPLGIDAWDLPLLCLFIFQPNRPERDDTRANLYSPQANMAGQQRLRVGGEKSACLCSQISTTC